MIRRWLMIGGLALTGLVFAQSSMGGCIRVVFEHYCLGGSFSQLLRERAPDFAPVTDGDRRGVVYRAERELVYVMAYRDHIYKILHTYEPGNQVTFKELQRHLQEKYGQPADQSVFPDYVRNMSGKIGAIRRGEGEMHLVWHPPGEAWHIELSWMRKPGISIAYLADELDAEQQKARLDGL
ncbi:MAG: hypothetical protein ABW101_04750 [Candidatus Thiodiazotropha sp.]